MMMRLRRPITYTGLLLAWGVFAAWQYHDYRHERELAQEILHRQSHSVMNALVGGIRSHRRLGRFFEDQLQGMLDELVKSEDVLAVAVTGEDGRRLLSAGEAGLLDRSPAAGDDGDAAGFWLVEQFELSPIPTGPDGAGGGGRGPGRGYGLRWRVDDSPPQSLFSDGGTFAATLVLDRTRADAQCRSAARSRTLVVAAGALVLICVALAWRATVRMVEARGRAQVLETEARYLRQLSQAAAGLAHETRNPLGLVRGWTQRLAQALPSVAVCSKLPPDGRHSTEQQQQHAQAVVEECDRITSRLNQFLAFAKPCEPTLQPIDPAEVIEELALLLQPDLEMKNLQLEYRVAKPSRAIQADREMLRQALFNLMQNAIQASPEGATVEIDVAPGQDGTCRIEVADHGPGVAPSAVEALFTPYFTTRSDGTGLGLAIVQRIALAHGWRVEYIPRPGGGAVFRLDRIHG